MAHIRLKSCTRSIGAAGPVPLSKLGGDRDDRPRRRPRADHSRHAGCNPRRSVTPPLADIPPSDRARAATQRRLLFQTTRRWWGLSKRSPAITNLAQPSGNRGCRAGWPDFASTRANKVQELLGRGCDHGDLRDSVSDRDSHQLRLPMRFWWSCFAQPAPVEQRIPPCQRWIAGDGDHDLSCVAAESAAVLVKLIPFVGGLGARHT